MNVLLPQPIAAEAIALLEKEKCAITVSPDPKPETVLPLLKGAHGLILRTGITISRDLIAETDDLLVISRTGGGLDNVDVEAATEKGIIVTSNLGVNTISVVEHVLSLMLGLSKKIALMDRAVREGNFSIRYKSLPRDLHKKTLGLIGFGRIGSKLGYICRKAFNMRVIAHDPYLSDEVREKGKNDATFVGLDELVSNSDVVSIHVPLTDKTRHLLGETEISMMKPDSILINTSRGGVVDEAALVKSLRDKKIGGAALDVFSQEPVALDNPLLDMENAVFTPHTAALTQECVIRMAEEAAKCVLDVFAGKEPANVADREVFKNDRWKDIVPIGLD